MKQAFFILFLLSLIIGCLNICKRTDNDDIRIALPEELYASAGYEDTLCDMLNKKLRLLVYMDSTACSNCWAKSIVRWYEIVNYIESKDSLVSMIMVFAPKQKDMNMWKNIVNKNPLDYPMFVDTCNSMADTNDYLTNKSFMGLLNEDGQVIVEGNLSSGKVLDKYKRIIESYEQE